MYVRTPSKHASDMRVRARQKRFRYGVITHPAVGRLKHTLALLPKGSLKIIAMIEIILSPNQNHETYRQRLDAAQLGLP